MVQQICIDALKSGSQFANTVIETKSQVACLIKSNLRLDIKRSDLKWTDQRIGAGTHRHRHRRRIGRSQTEEQCHHNESGLLSNVPGQKHSFEFIITPPKVGPGRKPDLCFAENVSLARFFGRKKKFLPIKCEHFLSKNLALDLFYGHPEIPFHHPLLLFCGAVRNCRCEALPNARSITASRALR